MTSRLDSRSWSCGSLVAGAAAVADQMASPFPDVVRSNRELLAETAGLDEAALRAMLQAGAAAAHAYV